MEVNEAILSDLVDGEAVWWADHPDAGEDACPTRPADHELLSRAR